MGQRAIITINESLEELGLLYKKTRNHKSKLRIKSLILTKINKFKTRAELSNHLGIGLRTLFDWIKKYQAEGIEVMINSTSGGKHHMVIPPEIKESLREKLNNSEDPLQGYNDAVFWVKSKHNIDLNYHTLRSFMIVNFGTKLKQPRKSHYKKEEQAFEAFKKTS